MDQWHFIAERKIREAMDQGAFDHLEGTGEPLNLTENPFEDPSLRMAHRILKNNGVAPAWIEESNDIERESRSLRNAGAVLNHDFRKRVEALNRRIAIFNLKVPVQRLQKSWFEISK
jgi:hypothetical protein